MCNKAASYMYVCTYVSMYVCMYVWNYPAIFKTVCLAARINCKIISLANLLLSRMLQTDNEQVISLRQSDLYLCSTQYIITYACTITVTASASCCMLCCTFRDLTAINAFTAIEVSEGEAWINWPSEARHEFEHGFKNLYRIKKWCRFPARA